MGLKREFGLSLANIYGSAPDKPDFYEKFNDRITEIIECCIILCVGKNWVLDFNKDWVTDTPIYHKIIIFL